MSSHGKRRSRSASAARRPNRLVTLARRADAWRPADAFLASTNFLADFEMVWERPATCQGCGEAILASQVVAWFGSAPGGLWHADCLARQRQRAGRDRSSGEFAGLEDGTA